MWDDPQERELDALMARLSDGDRAAFDPLFAALHPRVLRLARARLDPSSAADAAQATLFKVFERAAVFEPGRPVLPWFYAIASNEIRALARAHHGRAARHVDAAQADTVPAGSDPEGELVDRELRRALDHALARLDEVSAEAISAVLGWGAPPAAVTSGAFRKRVSRAYSQLRLLLGGSYGG